MIEVKSEIGNLEITNKDIIKIDNDMSDENINSNSQDNIPILLETKRNKKANKRKKNDININVTDEDSEENDMICFYNTDEGRPLGKGEHVAREWSF